MSWEQDELQTIKLEHKGMKKKHNNNNSKDKISYCDINA